MSLQLFQIFNWQEKKPKYSRGKLPLSFNLLPQKYRQTQEEKTLSLHQNPLIHFIVVLYGFYSGF